MAAHLAQLAFVHDQNTVDVLNGRKAMGDHQGCPVFHQLGQGVFNEEFGLWVNARRRFVHNQDSRVVGQGSGKGQQLTLAGGQIGATFV